MCPCTYTCREMHALQFLVSYETGKDSNLSYYAYTDENLKPPPDIYISITKTLFKYFTPISQEDVTICEVTIFCTV